MKKSNLKTLANFLYEVGTMRKIARAHRQTLMTDDLSDNIASHSYRVCVIGWFLANLEKVDPYKVVTMCLFHDVSEVRSGDQNWVHKKYVKVFEEEIITDQLKDLPEERKLVELAKEYGKRESKEAKIAKDADVLDQILLIREYVLMGNKEAAIWFKGKGSHVKMLTSKSAIRLADELLQIDPADWWHDLWTSKRR